MKLLILAPYPPQKAPSQRFRFEHYLGALEAAGIDYDYQPFLQEKTWNILYQAGKKGAKAWGVLKSFLRRWGLMLRLKKYDAVFIHREAAPLGPPIFEWIIAKIWRKPIVYDFDDAIWMANTSAQNRIAAGLKWHGKVGPICRWAHTVTVGNAFLGDYAQRFNQQVVHIPTVVNTQEQHQPATDAPEELAVGWTGSHSTMRYLDTFYPIIEALQQEVPFTFYVISNKAPENAPSNVHFLPWNKATEIQDLQRFQIGVMPLADEDWAKGKCGFKAIQYMALGMPALVSPVGVNTEIVRDGIDGFHCRNAAEWKAALRQLLQDAALRTKMGANARKRIVEHYSVEATQAHFIQTLKKTQL